VAYLIALIQRPGLTTADTKINLHVDPIRFLGDVASMWSSSGALGDVRTGQTAGYLFPMGPFFALGHLIGLPEWVVQRLWLGTLLWLAAWGVVRLLGRLLPRVSVPGELVAGAVAVFNPFVVTYANRTTVTFLAYAALPWLMLAVHDGLREPRRWRRPAAVALLVTASGGGINGAVTAWMLLGPALLLLYEWGQRAVTWPQIRSFLARAVPLTVLASPWWVIPAYVQSSYGINFLHFTEQPGTVWGTTSLTESLRLMSFWLSYVGLGFAGHAIPYFQDSHTLLFSAPVVVATLLAPALALAGFAVTRRWRYGPFFLGLALAALLVMGAGFPEGTPLRHGLNLTYRHVAAVQFLRASYKAAPLLALALACLAGGATAGIWPWLAARARGAVWRAGFATAVIVVLALAAWPLSTGRAPDPQVSYDRVPGAWTAAAAGLDRALPANSRAVVLPGDLFSFYTWGGTQDPILPALTRRPVAERTQVPYADLRATDLLWTIDALVHQRRLLPGQLPALLSLISARSVITGSDDDLARSDAPNPADAASVLAAQPGFARSARAYGPVRSFAPSGLGSPVALPEIRRYDLAGARGLIRVEPVAQPVIVDGSAAGVAGLAAFRALPAGRALRYAADLSAAQLRGALASGGQLVITDSNRRQAFAPGSLEQNTGAVLTAGENVSADGLILDPFGGSPDDETVSVDSGLSGVQAPFSPQTRQYPEHAAFAALDGSPATAWLADPTLAPANRWLQTEFTAPRPVAAVDLLPAPAIDGAVHAVAIAGRSFAVHPGWNHLGLGLRSAGSLRVTLTGVSAPAGGGPGAGGIAELRIPGLHPAQTLRLPVDAARAAAAPVALRAAALSYIFSRVTGDDPFARDRAAAATPPAGASSVPQAGDAETAMRRVFTVPVARRFTASAWVTALDTAPDDALDRLAGVRGRASVTSSSRFDGAPGVRGSMALDGSQATAWVGDWAPPARPWLSVALRSPQTVHRLQIVPATVPVRRPTVVSVVTPSSASPPLRVSRSGEVILPRAFRTRRLRIVVLAAVAPAGATSAQRRAVGIAELQGLGPAGAVRAPLRPRIESSCGAAAFVADGVRVRLRVSGSARAFAAGTPLPARSCGAPFTLPAGTGTLAVAPGALAVDALRLSSPAPAPVAVAAGAGSSGGVAVSGATGAGGSGGPAGPTGRVTAVGTAAHGAYNGIRVAVTAPSWLVLGEGLNRGWQAFCDGSALGAPVPIDGYANGWRIGPSCHTVRFAFAPNQLAKLGYLISGLAGLVCLLILILSRRRRPPSRVRSRAPQFTPAARPPDQRGAGVTPREPAPLRPVAALRAALLPALVFGFVFGIWPGVVSLPVLALILWRGVGAVRLTLIAAALLGIVVPVLYLAHPAQAAGGNQYGYAMAHLTAHYVGTAAFGLLLVAAWRAFPRRSAGPETGSAAGAGS